MNRFFAPFPLPPPAVPLQTGLQVPRGTPGRGVPPLLRFPVVGIWPWDTQRREGGSPRGRCVVCAGTAASETLE